MEWLFLEAVETDHASCWNALPSRACTGNVKFLSAISMSSFGGGRARDGAFLVSFYIRVYMYFKK
jgi:hypothetical protein